jgi:hypothetical protein
MGIGMLTAEGMEKFLAAKMRKSSKTGNEFFDRRVRNFTQMEKRFEPQ